MRSYTKYNYHRINDEADEHRCKVARSTYYGFTGDLTGARHLQTSLLFLVMLVCNALRVNFSVAIVAMTNAASSNLNFEEYNWNESTQSVILSSFFWGYVVTQIPGGIMARKFGSRILLMWSMGLCSVLTLLTYPAAHFGGWQTVIALRVAQGLCQGLIFPSAHTMLSKWAPPNERARLSTIVYAGQPMGNVLMLGTSGLIAASPIGWPSIFYISGGFGILWTILWFVFGSNSPEENKFISIEEKTYIQESLGQITDVEEIKKVHTPWKRIFSSSAFIALFCAHLAQNWGFWTLLTEIPTYLNKVMEFDIKENALLSALPYFVMFILNLSLGVLSDFLINKGYLTVGQSRKVFNSFGHYLPALALIGLGYVSKDDKTLAIVLLVLAVGFNSGSFVGFLLNHMDLSPVFAGTLMGVTNFAANIMSILGPLFVGLIVTDATDPTLWRIAFFVAAGFYIVGNTIFVIFGKGSIQPWNSEQVRVTEESPSERNFSMKNPDTSDEAKESDLSKNLKMF